MFGSVKIFLGLKITLLVIGVVLTSILVIGLIAYERSKKAVTARHLESIEVIAQLKARQVGSFFERIKSNIEFSAQLKVVQERLSSANYLFTENITQQDTIRFLLDQDSLNINDSIQEIPLAENFLGGDESLQDFFTKILKNFQINNVFLTNQEGRIVFSEGEIKKSRNQALEGRFFGDLNQDGDIISAGRDSVFFSNVVIDSDSNALNGKESYIKHMYVSAPVINQKEELLGVLIYDVNLQTVYDMVADSTGLGTTGEILLATYININNSIFFQNPKRGQEFYIFLRERNWSIRTDRKIPSQDAVKGIKGSGFAKNRDNKDILAAWLPVPVINWGLTVEFDKDEIYQPVYNLMYWLIYWGLAILAIAIFLGLLFSNVLTNPLIKLKEVVNLLSRGVLPEKLRNTSQDEIGEMADKINDLVENLRNTASFAEKIGHGDFESDFNPLSEVDTLGNALLSMRDSIQQSAQRDDERNWIVTGLAEIGDILPSISTIEELGELVSEYVTNKIGAVQGAFYTVNDEDKENPIIEMNASYAYNKKKYLKAQFKFAEGLVGQAAIEQDTIVRTEIPDDYMTISSGILGDQKPKCILITPLITNEKVYGVLEFAGFERFSHREIEFVEEISEIIARTVFNIKVRENTEKLLFESQKMSSELRVQQEVLRQNAEEMEATQEELQRTNKELETQIREVQRATDRTRLLLENASEVITIYEADATIRYISPSVEKILGYTQEEMIGIRDIAYVHPDGVEAYEQMFKDLLDKPDEKVTIEFSYQTKSGQRIWLEATGTNLFSDPAIQGIVLNTRDITERRAAEREQRLRGQMQALSENSPDLITRISKEGTVFYINPTIETYTGKNKDNFLQKHLKELELEGEILESWNDILKEVITKNQKIALDMDFPSIMGERVMQVNAIPEYNDQSNLESVLVVSHDITERKIIELEISQKNRKITESINYAKRIQEAILPDTNYIRQFLKDSFILYKPRDVVSGDFPWFLQKNDNIYIAAVDCTGHGVPGALISLIGFFLLNNIVNVKEADTPGEILDILDEEVTKTLKQDESDSSTKDGMDISLCKINTKKGQLEYAGAHRPLYYLTDGELHEIKGNKFPIGGAQYKNRGKFTNTVINYKDNDSVYLFSDGFPDQFGGPKNKKFSPRRIREIIKNNSNLELAEINRILDNQFEDWRGNNKQTDDVLMIGIKL